MEHKYPGVVDYLVEQGWTKLVLFARDNPLGVGPTTTHTLSLARAHKPKHTCRCVGPTCRSSTSSVKQAVRLLGSILCRSVDAWGHTVVLEFRVSKSGTHGILVAEGILFLFLDI
jgi:hypothetical protein